MKKIFLSNGQVSLVSDEDFLYLSGYNWWPGKMNREFVQGRIGGKRCAMHHVILKRMGIDRDDKVTDHIDGNPLNNQRSNLRVATYSQNNMNVARLKRNKSGYKGVSWKKDHQKWESHIQFNGQVHYLGLFDTPEEAHTAYCEAAEYYFGEFARTE